MFKEMFEKKEKSEKDINVTIIDAKMGETKELLDHLVNHRPTEEDKEVARKNARKQMVDLCSRFAVELDAATKIEAFGENTEKTIMDMLNDCINTYKEMPENEREARLLTGAMLGKTFGNMAYRIEAIADKYLGDNHESDN